MHNLTRERAVNVPIGGLYIGGVQVNATAADLNAVTGDSETNADLVKLHAITATAAEINVLHTSTATTADLNLIAGVAAASKTVAYGQQVSLIAAPTGGSTIDTAARTAINLIITALEGFKIAASS